MKFVPRFLTDGNAVAVGGYVHRVNDNVVRRNIPGPSASTSLGGSSHATLADFRFLAEPEAEPVVSVGSSSMKAWHEQEGGEKGNKQTHTTHATSSVDDVVVGQRLFVKRANAYLKSVHRAGQAQPTVTPVEAQLDGLVIDGVRFTVTLDSRPACRFGTYSAFQNACATNEKFKKSHGKRVLDLSKTTRSAARSAGKKSAKAAQPPEKGCIVCSLVERIDWEGTLPDGAQVDSDSHVIVWPDFGTIILGEMLISDFNRRLTMVRLELGSPLKGSMALVDVQSGGQGLP
jgi:hypothetical protein